MSVKTKIVMIHGVEATYCEDTEMPSKYYLVSKQGFHKLWSLITNEAPPSEDSTRAVLMRYQEVPVFINPDMEESDDTKRI